MPVKCPKCGYEFEPSVEEKPIEEKPAEEVAAQLTEAITEGEASEESTQ